MWVPIIELVPVGVYVYCKCLRDSAAVTAGGFEMRDGDGKTQEI